MVVDPLFSSDYIYLYLLHLGTSHIAHYDIMNSPEDGFELQSCQVEVTLLTNKATRPVATLIFVYCWTVHHQEFLPTLLNSDTFTCKRLISIKSQKKNTNVLKKYS